MRSRRASRKLRRAIGASVKQSSRRSSAAPRPPRRSVGKRIAKGMVSVVALALAAAFAIATAGSPLLFSSASASASSIVKTTKSVSPTIDAKHISALAGTGTPISRDSVQALSARELYDATTGDVGYVVNNSGPIRWPFNSAVGVSSPFGYRVAPCSGCSTFHNGTDFATGDDAPIYSVAAGTVTASEYGGSYGQYISIDSVVNGKAFTAVYAHMTAGSETVKVGATVTEGEPLGLTGCTGECTGAHLDFEININSIPVDSFVWLKANTAH
jgi:murein DD-endopeptidase MepM/ murein hydrolase activator NlpD